MLRSYALPLSGLTRLSQVYSYAGRVFADQPVGYWRLAEAAGTSAIDASGQAHPGTYTGGVTLGQPGAIAGGDTAILLDGTTGYVDMGNVAAFNFTGAFSAEAWIKTSDQLHNLTIVAKTNWATGAGWHLGFQSGKLVAWAYTPAAALVFNFNTAPLLYSDNRWHHVALVWDGTTYPNGVTLFADGAIVKQATALAGVPGNAIEAFRIGSSLNVPNFFPGAIDEVAVYAYALTPAQIAAHYATGLTVVDAAANIPYRELILRADPGPVSIGDASISATGLAASPSGIILVGPSGGGGGGGGSAYAAAVKADGATHHWRLGEASGTVAADSIGTAPGTISGGVTLAQPGALADGDTAMSFDGTTGQVQTAASVALSPSWTIEAWIRPTVAGYGMAAGNLGDSGKDEWALGTADLSGTTVGMFAFRYGGGGGGSLQNPTGVLTLNAWHHLVATWAAPNMALFLDGVLSQPMTFIPGPMAIAGRVSIGQVPPPAYWAMKFAGGVDEVAIYPTALTPAQIAAHYALRTSPTVEEQATSIAGANGLILGPFATGPLKLSDLWAVGDGSTLNILGVPY